MRGVRGAIGGELAGSRWGDEGWRSLTVHVTMRADRLRTMALCAPPTNSEIGLDGTVRCAAIAAVVQGASA